MRHILRQRELVADRVALPGRGRRRAAMPLIVPLAELREDPASTGASAADRLGVRLSPADRVEELVDELPHLDLIAVEFPSPGEGRGYSQGRLLRERFGFPANCAPWVPACARTWYSCSRAAASMPWSWPRARMSPPRRWPSAATTSPTSPAPRR